MRCDLRQGPAWRAAVRPLSRRVAAELKSRSVLLVTRGENMWLVGTRGPYPGIPASLAARRLSEDRPWNGVVRRSARRRKSGAYVKQPVREHRARPNRSHK
jgi:hypothetical protein